MAVWQTPAQRNDLERQVKNLTEAAGNKVQRPMNSDGTFVMTDGGWVNTTSNKWSQAPHEKSDVPWLCKWGPVNTHYITDSEETAEAMRAKGKTHLYIYFGYDTLPQRNLVENWFSGPCQWATTSSSKDIISTVFAVASKEDRKKPTFFQLNTGMFEINPTLGGGSGTIDETTKVLRPNNIPATYYTGWVETPIEYKEDYSFTVCAELWAHMPLGEDIPDDLLVYIRDASYTLVIYQYPEITELQVSRDSTVFNYNTAGTMFVGNLGSITIPNNTKIGLTRKASNSVKITFRCNSVEPTLSAGALQYQNVAGAIVFDDTDTDQLTQFQLGFTKTSVAFSDTKRVGGYLPFFKLYGNDNLRTIMEDDTHGFISTSNMRYKGQQVYMPFLGIGGDEAVAIELVNGYDSFSQLQPDQQPYTVNPRTIDFYPITFTAIRKEWCRVWLPQLWMPGTYRTANIEWYEFNYYSRILWHKQYQIFVLQFTNTCGLQGSAAYEAPEGYEIVEPWRIFGYLDGRAARNTEYWDNTILYDPTITKAIRFGVIDESDCITDSEMADLSALNSRFRSIEHSNKSMISLSADPAALQLFKFNDLDYKVDNITEFDDVIIRHRDEGNTSAYVSYASLSDLAGMTQVDTILTERFPHKRKSIDKQTLTEVDPETGEEKLNTYLELYGFTNGLPALPALYQLGFASRLSAYTSVNFTARTLSSINDSDDEAKIQYVTASEVLNTAGDHNYADIFQQQQQGAFKQHSLDTQFKYQTETKRYIGQLYNFNTTTADATPTIRDEVSSLQFLAKDVTDNHDLILKYIDLKNLLNDYKGPWWYDKENNCFQNRYVQYGNEIVEVAQTTVTQPGNYWVHVTHPLQGQRTTEVVRGNGGTSDGDNSWFLVATLTGQAGNLVQTFGIYAYPVVFLYLT